MAKLLKLRRGSTTQHASFTGAEGEVTIDTTKDTAVVHDGAQAGGKPLAREDMSNVSSASIAGQLGTDSIAVGKIAAGTLPSDVKIVDANVSGNLTIESADIVNGTIATADIGADQITNALIADDQIDSEHYVDGSIDTAHLADDAVTYGKMQNTANGARLLGKISSGGGQIQEQTAAEVRTFLNVEDGSTGDQTAAEIRTLVESATDSNVFTDADHTKLNGIETAATADQTDAEISTALRGQVLGTSSDGVHNVYTDDWFRNNNSGAGLYNEATTQHWYSDHDDYWNIAGGGSANAIRFRDDFDSNIRGYVYADNANQIGFLNSGSSWSFKVDNSGNATATGNVTAYSDARLKTNVNTINDALGICGKLRGVSYDWIKDGKHSIGVIAQEVEKVLPEVVLTQQVKDPTGEREIKSVDYGKIVGVLINAINELKAEVDELKGGK